MQPDLLAAAGDALLTILEPARLLILSAGVLVGLALGIIPGVGGLVGMALLLPFTFTMDPYSAFAILLGITAVTGTSDTIPAVLLGVPGTSGAQATVMDGHPMAKRGEAGRALAAAYTASMLGGLFGALLLALCVPLLRPFILSFGSPELLAISVFGISMVAMLSGNAPLRGLAGAGLGILISMIGADPQSGTLRWTMGTFYLWEGLPLIPLILGLFALPELADLAIRRAAIASDGPVEGADSGMRQGIGDALRNWFLVIRCGGLGALVGAIPGLGSSVVDWLAYGHAKATVKGADKTFGTGDVRGVIAPESANNSITAGALIPTVAFGVPGTGGMALVLGAFMIHGLRPGPDMLTTNIDVTYTMVWSIAIANILGAAICILFSRQFAKLALLRYTLILPIVLGIVCVGAFQSSRSWGDLAVLLGLGLLGWVMKRLRWPRPPVILGFVLGAIIENYMFISIGRYGADWLTRPLVLLFFGLALAGLLRHVWRHVPAIRRTFALRSTPRADWSDLLHVAVLALVAVMLWVSIGWAFEARIGPQIVAAFVLSITAADLAARVFGRGAGALTEGAEGGHMDLASDLSHLDGRTIGGRVALFFGWIVAFCAASWAVGMIPACFLLVLCYMRVEGREPWRLTLACAAGFTVFVWLVFERILGIYWPASLLGELVPALGALPSV